MTRPLHGLLETDPAVAASGVPLFAEALRAQAVPVVEVEWRPPLGGSEAALARVMADPRREAANAEAFDVNRERTPHLTFGYGFHACLGNALARIEGRVALDEILNRFPEWEVDLEHAELSSTSTVRGWETLPAYTSRAKAAGRPRFAAQAAKTHGLFVHASLYQHAPVDPDGADDGRGLNTAILVSPDGELVARTHKLHIPISAGYYEDTYFRPGPATDPFPVHQVTEHFHEFAMGLQTDAAGNFYYAKAARHAKTALVPHHGTLLCVSRDGSRTDILATGFRAPNGVCVNADGTFFLTDQEGHWIPKNRINWIKDGGFYGNFWGCHDLIDSSDAAMKPPLCWITNAFDRSPAELLWATSDRWGPLKGSLLN